MFEYPKDFILSANKYCEYDFDTLRNIANHIDQETIERILYIFGITEQEIKCAELYYKCNYSFKGVAAECKINPNTVNSAMTKMRKTIGSKAFEFIYINDGINKFYFDTHINMMRPPYKLDDLLIIAIQLGELSINDIYTSNITTYYDLIDNYTIRDLLEYYNSGKLFYKEFNLDTKIRDRVFRFLYRNKFLTFDDRIRFKNESEFREHAKLMNRNALSDI